jgi:CRISPR-associated protein Csd2
MKMLTKKIDFAIIIGVKNANPNGDPLNGNRPRTTYDGHGEISDVCLKRKLRNRLLDAGEAILVQSNDYCIDDYRSIKARYDANLEIAKAVNDRETQKNIACKTWIDVRMFGQVLAFKAKNSRKKKDVDEEEKESSISIGIRGPVSIQSAYSVETVDITSLQITKSVNLETQDDPDKKASDTLGMKHRVDKGVYVAFGSINKQLAEKTGFSDTDAVKLKTAMRRLFENDESSARPGGSMEVVKVIWWTHGEKILPSAQVHRSLHVNSDGSYALKSIEGINPPEELCGL